MKKLLAGILLLVFVGGIFANPIPPGLGRDSWDAYTPHEKEAFIFGVQIATYMMSLAYEIASTRSELAREKERLQRITELRATDLVRHLDRELLNESTWTPLMDVLYEIPERVFPRSGRSRN